jgi:hypothetical protein
MKTTTLRHRAAVIGWTLRRGGLATWRECVTVGLAVASALAAASRDEHPYSVAEDTIARLVRAGELTIRTTVTHLAGGIMYALNEDKRYQRAIVSSRLAVPSRALLEATRGRTRPTWEDLARLSLVRSRSCPVYLDRSRYAAQVEEFVAEQEPPRSVLGDLMGFGGEA